MAEHDDDSLSVLDADSLLPITSVGAGGGSNGVAYRPGRGLIYIANFRPTAAGDHTAIVSLDGGALGSHSFVVVEPGKANGKGKGVDK